MISSSSSGGELADHTAVNYVDYCAITYTMEYLNGLFRMSAADSATTVRF